MRKIAITISFAQIEINSAKNVGIGITPIASERLLIDKLVIAAVLQNEQKI